MLRGLASRSPKSPPLATLLELGEDEAHAAGAWANDLPPEPTYQRFDPRPNPGTDFVTDPTGVMGEDEAGVWTRLHLDRVLDLEPSVWGVYDAWCIDPDRNPNLDRDSAFEVDALLTLQGARARATAPDPRPNPDGPSED